MAVFLISFLFYLTDQLSKREVQFELIELKSDVFYYNSLVKDGSLFVGSSIGVFEWNKGFELYSREITGPIKLEQGDIIQGINPSFNKNYNYLLPNYQLTSTTNGSFYDNKVFLISSGKLYIFQKVKVPRINLPSVRSISQSFIGTYGGIYNKTSGEKLLYPTHTDGYIREYGDTTYICWGGLTIKSSGAPDRTYYSSVLKSIVISDKPIGEAIDVVEFYDKIILVTNLGFFILDLNSERILLEIPSSDSRSFIVYADISESSDTSIVYFFVNNSLYALNKNLEYRIIETFDDEILSGYSDDSNSFYLVQSDRLIEYNYQTKIQETILSGISQPLDVISINKYLILTTLQGLTVINRESEIVINNLISDEFNKHGIFKQNNTVELGTVSGMYRLDETILDSIFDEILQRDKSIGMDVLTRTRLYQVIILCFFLVGLGYVLYPKKRPQIEEISKNRLLEYIDENISEVGIISLKNHFGLSNTQLYNIFKDESPGEYIRKQRILILKNLLKINASYEEISAKTGFSKTYIRKIVNDLEK